MAPVIGDGAESPRSPRRSRPFRDGDRQTTSGPRCSTAGITNRNYLSLEAVERTGPRCGSFGADTGLLGIDRVGGGRRRPRGRRGRRGPPPVVAFLPEAGCLVTRFVDGAPIPVEDLERRDVLEARGALGADRARLHRRSPRPSPCSGSWRATRSWRGIVASRPPSAYAEAHELADRIEAAFARAPIRRPPATTTC